VKRVFILLNDAFAVTILDLISHVQLVSLLSGYPNSNGCNKSRWKAAKQLKIEGKEDPDS
jgi:hypothetical protein